MISIALDPSTEQRLAELAKRQGLSDGDFARQLIESSIEDIEDIQMAADRSENRQDAQRRVVLVVGVGHRKDVYR